MKQWIISPSLEKVNSGLSTIQCARLGLGSLLGKANAAIGYFCQVPVHDLLMLRAVDTRIYAAYLWPYRLNEDDSDLKHAKPETISVRGEVSRLQYNASPLHAQQQ
jgi:hypothetical protein